MAAWRIVQVFLGTTDAPWCRQCIEHYHIRTARALIVDDETGHSEEVCESHCLAMTGVKPVPDQRGRMYFGRTFLQSYEQKWAVDSVPIDVLRAELSKPDQQDSQRCGTRHRPHLWPSGVPGSSSPEDRGERRMVTAKRPARTGPMRVEIGVSRAALRSECKPRNT